jgi:hypothetical protein
MPQCQFPVFCYFCVSEKLHRKYSRNWTKQNPNIEKFTEASRELKRRRNGAPSPIKTPDGLENLPKLPEKFTQGLAAPPYGEPHLVHF